jgi:hypothetical protein
MGQGLPACQQPQACGARRLQSLVVPAQAAAAGSSSATPRRILLTLQPVRPGCIRHSARRGGRPASARRTCDWSSREGRRMWHQVWCRKELGGLR